MLCRFFCWFLSWRGSVTSSTPSTKRPGGMWPNFSTWSLLLLLLVWYVNNEQFKKYATYIICNMYVMYVIVGECLGDISWSTTRSSFLWANATLLVGAGHLWHTQTENLHPHCKRPGTACLILQCIIISWIVILSFSYGQYGIGDKFRFTTFCLQYAVYLLQLVLSVIPEPKKKRDYSILTEVRGL